MSNPDNDLCLPIIILFDQISTITESIDYLDNPVDLQNLIDEFDYGVCFMKTAHGRLNKSDNVSKEQLMMIIMLTQRMRRLYTIIKNILEELDYDIEDPLYYKYFETLK